VIVAQATAAAAVRDQGAKAMVLVSEKAKLWNITTNMSRLCR